DIRDPAESYSAGQFRQDALREIEAVYEAGRIPLLAGGTFLYFRALEYGWADLPEADVKIRSEIDDEGESKGWSVMHAELAIVDPAAADRIHPNDAQRIQRALEVFRITGEPLSNWQQWSKHSCPFVVTKMAIQPQSRENLSERISARFDRMIEQGFLDEVERLFTRGDLTDKLPSIRAVGYRQLWRHLAGDYDLQTAKERAVIATRQLAKRQMTWLRSEPDLAWIQGHSHAERWHSMREVLKQLQVA
ncbi:MAG: tRNA (adenosine(37)-N6)-dimethylallyltransferase MiaA, partial [Gammaproteobacteria bacterium]|nr:tRNA (adenosine(37)-N6)-dimethylallyltransferase MiaA [Gammaproteobacteria bacterium]